MKDMEKESNLQFLGYKIKKSVLDFEEGAYTNLNVTFEPKGKINNEKKLFILTLLVKIESEKKVFKSEVEIVGNFRFSNREDENMESFLFLNAPAILFPYVRAYINTLSTLSGNQSVILPTLNLTGLKEKLKENTEEI